MTYKLPIIPELSSKPVYNPLDDVASDGFVDLNQVAKPAAAPTYTGKLWPRFKNWAADFSGALVVVALVVAAIFMALDNHVHNPTVVPTKPAIAVTGNPSTPVSASPVPAKRPTPAKTATQTVATQAINTPVFSDAGIPVSIPAPEPLTPAEQDFANRLANFESKTP